MTRLLALAFLLTTLALGPGCAPDKAPEAASPERDAGVEDSADGQNDPPEVDRVVEDAECGSDCQDAALPDADLPDAQEDADDPCRPTDELCDEADNDCDGLIDEGFDLGADPLHCGRCGARCEVPGATPACVEGRCAVAACDEDRYDLNGLPDDGCEYACDAERQDREVVCDGLDNDCDGLVDEDGLDEPCDLGLEANGAQVCAEGALVCAAGGPGPTPLCGDLAGLLTLEGSPYELTCDRARVAPGATLQVAQGVVVRAAGLQGATLHVEGTLRSEGASWEGISIDARGAVHLDGDTLRGDLGDALLRLTDAEGASLEALGVHLVGPGSMGLAVSGGGPEALRWSGGRIEGFARGIEIARAGDTRLTDLALSENQVAVHVGAEGAALALPGGLISRQDGEAGRGINILATDAEVSLEGLTLNLRDEDAAVTLDPDALHGLTGEATLDGDGRPGLHLRGALDLRPRVALTPRGGLDRFVVEGALEVAPGRTLEATATVALTGEPGAVLVLAGTLAASGGLLRDLPVRVLDAGQAQLDGATLAAEAPGTEGCLLEIQPGGAWTLAGAQLQGGVDPPEVDGLCVLDPAGIGPQERLEAMSASSLRRAVVIQGATGSMIITGMTVQECAVGLDFEGALAPAILGNTFRSRTDRQMVAIRMAVGAAPGGRVSGNTFDLDFADTTYRLDPDNLAAEGGTAFEGNLWVQGAPSGYLLEGTQTSPRAQIREVTERQSPDDFFLDIQLPGALRLAPGATLEVIAEGRIVTLQGIGGAPQGVALTIEGALEIEGPGVLVRDLPLHFLAGSGGRIRRAELSGDRVDVPLVTVEDAAPTLGGAGRADEVRLGGANEGLQVGVELRATRPMCGFEPGFCPFIANCSFRNLAVGVRVVSPADFSGVNDFDDANPNGDTVPINVERL